MEKSGETWSYIIDGENYIISYSRNFRDFAISNDWHYPESSVIGRNLFDFIEGIEVKHIYKILFEFVRQGKKIGPIPFRCDAPYARRFLELYLSPYPSPEGSIEVVTRLLRIERREPVVALMPNVPRSPEIMVMCSMCKKIKLKDGLWEEIENGLRELGIFESDKPPRISHGLCEDCFNNVMSHLERRTVEEQNPL